MPTATKAAKPLKAKAAKPQQKFIYTCLNCKSTFTGDDGEEKALRHVTADNTCTTRAYSIKKVSA